MMGTCVGDLMCFQVAKMQLEKFNWKLLNRPQKKNIKKVLDALGSFCAWCIIITIA